MYQALVSEAVFWVEVDSVVALGLAESVAESPPVEVVFTKGANSGVARW